LSVIVAAGCARWTTIGLATTLMAIVGYGIRDRVRPAAASVTGVRRR
jgi:hypothetical protein